MRAKLGLRIAALPKRLTITDYYGTGVRYYALAGGRGSGK